MGKEKEFMQKLMDYTIHKKVVWKPILNPEKFNLMKAYPKILNYNLSSSFSCAYKKSHFYLFYFEKDFFLLCIRINDYQGLTPYLDSECFADSLMELYTVIQKQNELLDALVSEFLNDEA